MDSNDLFKRLTTNLRFESGLASKRKVASLHENEDENKFDPKRIKAEPVEDSTSQPASTKHKNKAKKKKKNLLLINQENVNRLRNLNHINVNGNDIPDPLESIAQLLDTDAFSKLYGVKCPPKLVENLKSCKFDELTPVQMQVVPIMLNNRDLMACAPTGSGKTISFLFPLICHLSNLKAPDNNGIKALILAPTRELVQQTYLECCRLANGLNVNMHLISNSKNEIKKLKATEKQCTILITTPNRLIYLLSQEDFGDSLKKVEWLIVDEADKLFEEGQQSFRDQLGVIYKTCDNLKIRHSFFSATFTNDVEQWCKLNLNNVIQINAQNLRNKASYTIEQELVYVGNEEGKLMALRNLFRQGFEPPILIFVETKDRADYLFKELIYENINVDLISSDRTQTQLSLAIKRDNTIRSFRQGKIWVLICTELLGRGIDFKGVNLVVNYDFPLSGISYVHRIGRCGRAGRLGKALTFFTDDERPYLRKIVNIMRDSGCRVPEYMLDVKLVKEKTLKKLKLLKVKNKNNAKLAKVKPNKKKSQKSNKKVNHDNKKPKKVSKKIKKSNK